MSTRSHARSQWRLITTVAALLALAMAAVAIHDADALEQRIELLEAEQAVDDG